MPANGNEEIISRLMNQYGNSILRMCYMYLKDYQLIEEKYTGYTPRCCAIFVADGIRYTLSGQVELETMKEIVDSLLFTGQECALAAHSVRT